MAAAPSTPRPLVGRAARRRAALGAALSLGVAAHGCVTDHDSLALRDRTDAAAGTSAAGAAGSAGQAGGSGAGAGGAAGGGSGGSSGVAGVAGAAGAAGSGATAITIVHGVVDAAKIAVCFVRPGTGPVGDPLPSAGLAFGEPLVLAAVPGIDLAADAVQPVVIAGELDLIAGMDCTEAIAEAKASSAAGAGGSAGVAGASGSGGVAGVAGASAGAGGSAGAGASAGAGGASGGGAAGADAGADGAAGNDASADADASDDGALDASLDVGVEAPPPPPPPPPLRTGELPVIPAGSLLGQSILLVAHGCIGGPAFVDSIDEIVCGTGYSPSAPTLSAVLVAMSRDTKPDKLGLQFLNASRAATAMDLRSTPPESGAGTVVTIATKVVLGAIRPKTPSFSQPAAGYGVPLGDSTLEVVYNGSSVASQTLPWATALALGGLGSVHDGSSYTLILIGPRPGVAGYSWWNPSTVTAVASDP